MIKREVAVKSETVANGEQTAKKPELPQMSLALQALLVNQLTSRADLMKSMSIDGRRDIDTECSYPPRNTAMYKKFYDEQGIAARVINVFPDECWEVDPEVYETEDEKSTPWEDEWHELCTDHNVYSYLKRLDQLAGVGFYGILLFGIDDGGKLDQPVVGIEDNPKDQEPLDYELLFLRVFDQSMVTIDTYENNPQNSRFGMPVLYSINMLDPTTAQAQGMQTQPTDGANVKVHWTRVMHFADGLRSNEVFGTPRLADVYDRCCDLRKILSGSGEMFWKGAFPGYSFEVNPDLVGSSPQMDPEELREEFMRYSEGLQRYLGLTGVTAKSLAIQVASPKDHLETQIDAIAMSKAIPKRILVGSERGELASSQDAMTWNGRVASRQRKTISPLLLRPFIKRCMAYGFISDIKKFYIHWADLNAPDDEKKAKTALAIAQTLAAYISSGADQIIPPMEFFTHVLNWPLEQAEAVIAAAMELIAKQDDYAQEQQATADAAAISQAAAAGKDPLGKPNPTPVGTVPVPRTILPPNLPTGKGKGKKPTGKKKPAVPTKAKALAK